MKELAAVISIAGRVDKSLDKSVAKTQSKFNKLKSGVGKTVKGIGVATAAGFASITAAAAVAGKGLYDLGTEFESAKNNIRVGTGATGKDLDKLYGTMKSVYKEVPTTMEDASTAIADYNTRLGLTGKPLKNISKQAINVSNVLGEDMSSVIEQSSKAMKQWNVSGKNMTKEMDYIFKVSQSTGVGFTELMSNMQSSGAVLQTLGFSFDQSAALIGNLEKEGINTSQVLKGMKKGLSSVAKSGGDTTKKMGEYVSSIKNAKTETEAVAKASEIFGTASASTMAQAIRKGALDVDALTKSLQGNSETINKAAGSTRTMEQKLQLLGQQAKTMFEPMASGVLDLVQDVFPYLQKAMDKIGPVVAKATKSVLPIFKEMADGIGSFFDEIGASFGPGILDVLANIGPMIKEVNATIGPMIKTIIKDLMPVMVKVGKAVLPVIMTLVREVGKALSEILPALLPIVNVITDIFSRIMPIANQLIGAILPMITQLIVALSPIIAEILQALSPIVDAVGDLVNTLLPALQSFFEELMPIITAVAHLISGVLGNAFKTLATIITSIKGVLTGITTFITGVFQGNWKMAWEGVKTILSSTFTGLVAILKAPINAIVGGINKLIDSINGVGFKVPDWVPVIGGKGFKLSIPKIPMLATGGFTDGPSIAGEAGREAVISFNPAYRADNVAYWREAGKMLGVSDSELWSLMDAPAHKSTTYNLGGVSFNPTINIQGAASKQDVVEALREEEENFFDLLDEWIDERGDDDVVFV